MAKGFWVSDGLQHIPKSLTWNAVVTVKPQYAISYRTIFGGWKNLLPGDTNMERT